MNLEQFASRGLKAQKAVDQAIDLSIDIEPYWIARVEVFQGKVSMRRDIEAPAKDAAQAKERMTAALSVVWKKFVFLTEPMLKARQK